jgi:hypothetical protein
MRFLAPFALLAPLAGAQATLHVPTDFPTIQAALDAAAPGDTVKVAQGVYKEHVQLRENVTLSGSGLRKTFLDGSGTGDVVKADGVHKFVLEHFTILGSKVTGGSLGSGVLINGTACCTFGLTATVRMCRIVHNGFGIRVTDVHTGMLTIDGNVIDRNLSDAIALHTGGTTIARNTIVDNGACGVRSTAGSGTVVGHSNVIAFNAQCGVLRAPSTPTTFSYNDVFGNAAGDYMQLVAGTPVSFTALPGTGELHADPGFWTLANGDYHPMSGSPLIGAGNPVLGPDFDGSAPEIGAYLYFTWYVPFSSNHGTSCGPIAGWFLEPIIGQGYFESHVSQAPILAPAVLMIGVSATSWQGIALPFNLGPLGAPGCALLTGPVITMPGTTDSGGGTKAKLPLPYDPVLVGAVLQQQWLVSAPSLNPLGLVFSDAVASTLLP